MLLVYAEEMAIAASDLYVLHRDYALVLARHPVEFRADCESASRQA
jgi:hypothetical protein